MMNDIGGSILKRIKDSIDCIQNNWNDDVSGHYLKFLQDVEKKIHDFERDREKISVKVEEIQSRCEKLLEAIDEKPTVPRTRVRKL